MAYQGAMDPYLTKEDLAALCRVPVRTTDSWVYTGSGPPFVRIGKHRRYRPEAVEAWLAAQERGGSQKNEPPTKGARLRAGATATTRGAPQILALGHRGLASEPGARRRLRQPRGPGLGKVQGRGDGDPRGTS